MRRKTTEDSTVETPRWPFPVFASVMCLAGFSLIAIGLPLEHFFVHRAFRLIAELMVEIGKALIITGAIAWILEVGHVVAYFEDRLFRVFMHPRFLEKLDRTVTLPGVHRAITTFLFGGTNDPEAGDYYTYLTHHHMKLAGETYRRNMDVAVEIENLDPPNLGRHPKPAIGSTPQSRP